jgi:hypothetical protein
MSADLFGDTPAAPAPVVSLRDMIASVGREVRMRESAYPKWVKSGRMTAGEAALELARMRAVLNLVSAIEAPSDALLETLAREMDREDSAMRGEPSPWRADPCGGHPDPDFKSERRAVARVGLVALAEAVR